jgi:hypothetical protein
MDITAHAVTLVSIIIGIGLTEMFGNLHRLIRHRRRVTWDWLPVVWSAILLLIVINYWWSIYLGVSGFQQAGSAAEFGLILIPSILLFLATASVLPNFDSDSEWDMRRYYDEHRKTFIVTQILYACSTWVVAVIIGTFGWNAGSMVRIVNISLMVLLVLVNKRRWDWIGVAFILSTLVYRLTTQVTR